MTQAILYEQSLLGGIIDATTTHPQDIHTLLHLLSPEFFSTDSARAVFNAILTLRQRGELIDLVALYSLSREPGPLHGTIRATYLCEIWDTRCSFDDLFAVMAWLMIRKPVSEP